jgi:hypothetical protein
MPKQTDRGEPLSLRVSPESRRRIEELVKRTPLNRSVLLRQLLRLGLDVAEGDVTALIKPPPRRP